MAQAPSYGAQHPLALSQAMYPARSCEADKGTKLDGMSTQLQGSTGWQRFK